MGRFVYKDRNGNIMKLPSYEGFYLSQVERRNGIVTAYVNSEEELDSIAYSEDTTLEEVKKDLKGLGIDTEKYHVYVFGMDDEIEHEIEREL